MQEVRIFAAGLLLWMSLLVTLVLLSGLRPEWVGALWAGMVAEIFTGREAGIPIALSGGAPPWLVASLSITQDIGSACLTYPIFLFILHHYHDRDNRIMRRLRRMEKTAAEHEKFVKKWGPIGVTIFMLLPFLINGPLVGAILGRLAGIHTIRLILPVLVATATAAFGFAYGFDALFFVTDKINPLIAPIMTGAIVAAVFLGFIVTEIRDARNDDSQE